LIISSKAEGKVAF